MTVRNINAIFKLATPQEIQERSNPSRNMTNRKSQGKV
jgi:hypothetical protein